MKPQVIHAQRLKVGELAIYSDDVGCWLEVKNGEEALEVLITKEDLDTLRHAILLNEDAIKSAEKVKEAANE